MYVEDRCFDMYDAVCGLKVSFNQGTQRKNDNSNCNVRKRAACRDNGVLIFDERSLLVELDFNTSATAILGLDNAFREQVRLRNTG